jgi:tight adherence protein B
MNQMILGLFLLIGFTVLFGFIGSLLALRRTKIASRLDKYTMRVNQDEPSDLQAGKEPKLSAGRRLIAAVGSRFEGKSFIGRWEKELERAGLPLKAGEFFVLRLLVAGIMTGIGYLMHFQGIALLPALWVGYLLPKFYMKRRKEKRLARCASQLAVSLGTMATAMRAGFSFMQAMQLVGREVPDPIGPEFDRTLREINFGVPVEEALQRLLERLPDADLELVITALLVQRSTGGNLSEILESMQETIHARVRIQEELKALTAQGRLSAWIISLLPIVLGVLINLMNPEYFSPLLTHPIGWMLLGMGAVSGLIGWMAIRKIVRIEV